MVLIDAEKIYEKTLDLEAQALNMVEKTMNGEDRNEWLLWSAVLKERTAFKHDIEDAPVIKYNEWIPCNELTREGLPTKDGVYYVTEQNYGYGLDAEDRRKVAHMCHYRNGDFHGRYYDDNYSNIIAWCKLLKPYIGDDAE